MEQSEIKELIVNHVAKVVDKEILLDAAPDTKLNDPLDSLEIVDLVMYLEKELGMTITDESIEEIAQLTVEATASHILTIYEQQH